MEEWVRTAWEAARQLGLLERWEFWVVMALFLVGLVLVRRLGPPIVLYWRSLPPPPDPESPSPSPPMPLDKDGTLHLDQKPPKDNL